MKKNIVIGTRGSELAMWQAHYTKDKLTQAGYEVSIKILKTQGDTIQDIPLHQIDGKGFFTKELEQALIDKEIDLAVHSHKDLPTLLPTGLCIAGTSYRHDSRDALLIRTDAIDRTQPFGLKKNAFVGTSSPRRAKQIQFYRDDISLLDIRGNVPTRIQKLQSKQYDAILLAVAGIERLALKPTDVYIQYLSPRSFIPAAAQGVLAYETRNDDTLVRQIVRDVLHDEDVSKSIEVERKILHDIDGGCKVACGIYTEYIDSKYHTWGFYQQDQHVIKTYFSDSNSQNIVQQTVQAFLRKSEPKKIFISTSTEECELLHKYCAARGWSLESNPLLSFRALDFEIDLDTDYYFFSSKKAVTYFFQYVQAKYSQHDWHNQKYIAIGTGTAAKIENLGYSCTHIYLKEKRAEIQALVKDKKVIFPSASQSLRSMQKELETTAIGKTVEVYENTIIENPLILPHDVAILTSPMSTQAYFQQGTRAHSYIAIGDSTAAAIQEHGHSCITAYEPNLEHIINSLASTI